MSSLEPPPANQSHGSAGRGARPPRGRASPRARNNNNPLGAASAKESKRKGRPPQPVRAHPCRGTRHRRGDPPPVCEPLRRLSATDISALASMKNVAKCDTWCELQNPVNHRVFERKLRPRPLGRGHACLGVTPPTAPPRGIPMPRRGAETGRPCPSPRRAVGRKGGHRAARHGVWGLRGDPSPIVRRARIPPRAVSPAGPDPARSRGRSDRDPRSGVATR